MVIYQKLSPTSKLRKHIIYYYVFVVLFATVSFREWLFISFDVTAARGSVCPVIGGNGHFMNDNGLSVIGII